MLLLFSSSLISIGYSQALPQISLSDYACTQGNTAACDALESTASAVNLEAICNQDLGFCSVDCSNDATACQSTTLALIGITGLTCDSEFGWCTTNFNCSNVDPVVNCTLNGFRKCSSKGVCIPENTMECDSPGAIDNDCPDGLKYCATQTIQSVDVDLCVVEPCDSDNANSTCATTDYICSNDQCIPPCQSRQECDPKFNNSSPLAGLLDYTGLICNYETGLCELPPPSESPTSDPTMEPAVNPVMSSITPTAPTTSEDDGDGAVGHFISISAVMIMAFNMIWNV